jgi:hypothetical protein
MYTGYVLSSNVIESVENILKIVIIAYKRKILALKP